MGGAYSQEQDGGREKTQSSRARQKELKEGWKRRETGVKGWTMEDEEGRRTSKRSRSGGSE